MKIAIPVQTKQNHSNLSQIFGRAPFFLIFDTQTNRSSFFESTFTGGQSAGILAARCMIDHQVDVLITNRCGDNAMRLLQAGNIAIYQAAASRADENLHLFSTGKLSLLSDLSNTDTLH